MLNISFRIFLFVLAFAPLAFGTVEYWSIMTVQVLTIVSLLICLVELRKAGEPVLDVPGFLPLVLFLGLMAVQLIPLPPAVVKGISPASYEAYRPVYELAGGGFWIPLTINQKASLQELLRFTTYALFYILTIQLLRRGSWINKTLSFVAGLAAAIAFIAILQQFSSNGLIYWFRPAPGGNPGGPWVNINQYAAFIGAMCPLVLALFLYYKPVSPVESSLREKVVAFFSAPRSNHYLFLGFAFVLLAFSVFVSLCRGGIVTILASMILFALIYGYKRRNMGMMSLWITLCLVLLAVSWFGWQPIISEFDRAFDASGTIRDARFQLWTDTLKIIEDYPLLGGGFGTFVDLYPYYQTVLQHLMFEHAHNDYLELAAGGGFIGFGLAAWFIVAVLVNGWRMVLARQDRLAVLVGIGSIVSISALLMHSMVDFNLQNGAVGLYFFFICGLMVAVVNHRYHHRNETSLLPSITGIRSSVLLWTTAVFLLFVSIVQLCLLIGGFSYTQVKHLYVSRYLAPELLSEVDAALKTSSRFDPLEGRYPFERGRVEISRQQPREAFEYSLRAARLQPMEGTYLQRLAMMLPASKDQQAEMLMEESYRRGLDKAGLLGGWIEWLLINGKREQAVEQFQIRIAENPQLLDSLVSLLVTYEFNLDEIETILPRSVQSWVRFGEYIEKTGDVDRAGYFRTRALDFLDSESEIRPQWFTQLISYYRRQKQPDEAIEVVRLGIEYIPDYAPFRIWLGDHYRQQDITFRAREEYERAVILDPDNETYKKKLRDLELDIEFGK